VTGLAPGRTYLLSCWMKYEFRGHQPEQLQFYLGVDLTGQTASADAGSIDWGEDQIAGKAPVHEVFTHVWRTFTATRPRASIWLRAYHPVSDPSVMLYVDGVELRQRADSPPPWLPGDFDDDADVDQEDFGRFQACLTGWGIAQNDAACQRALLDVDDDVDQDDFALFQACLNGPGTPADPDCAN